jgi:predicted nucleotidyltransferase
MRISPQQIDTIIQAARSIAGQDAQVWLFGSRLDDAARGGDLDLMLKLSEPVNNPALLTAQLSARVSRAMQGRKVDVLINAPNPMRLPIHELAFREGRLL